MTMEVIINPVVIIYQLLAFTIGLTAIAFIALLLWLDRTPKELPVALPGKPRLHHLHKMAMAVSKTNLAVSKSTRQ